MVASVDRSGAIALLQLDSGLVKRIAQVEPSDRIGFASSSVSGCLAVSSTPFDVSLIDFRTGDSVTTWHAHDEPISDIAFHGDGQMIATASRDRLIRIWDISNAFTPRLVATFYGHSRPVTSICFSPDGERLVSASDDQSIRLWDLDTEHEVLCLQGHKDSVIHVRFSSDGNSICSSDASGMIRVWTTNE